MSKIFYGEVIKKGYGSCDFCGTQDVVGALAEPIEIKDPKTEFRRVPKGKFDELSIYKKHVGYGLFGRTYGKEKWGYFTEDYNYREVVVRGKYNTRTFTSLICHDCIKQLAKQI